MSKKKSRREKAIMERARAYYKSQIAHMDKIAGELCDYYSRVGRKMQCHLIALMSCAVVHSQERDMQEIREEGRVPEEGEDIVLSYNVLKELEAYLDENEELSRYVDYLSYLMRERPSWVADRACGGQQLP